MAPHEESCKVDRVSAKWNLNDVDDRLRERRANDDSLRTLETFYNETVLEAAMEAAGMDPIDGAVSNLYRLLTDDSVSPGKRLDAESRLRRNGVDPSALDDDFVSHVTVRTHLNDCLDVATDRGGTLSVDEGRTRVLKIVSRTESVARQTVDRLTAAGRLSIPAPSVTVSVRVGCTECNAEYTFSRLLDRGGCACESQE